MTEAVVTSFPEPEQTEPLEDIAAWLSSGVASDPLLFVHQAFAWGEGELAKASGPEPWQAEILADIRDGLPLGRAIQIAVASGHGVGKTALIAWLVLWAISTFPDTRGIVTAATEPMLITVCARSCANGYACSRRAVGEELPSDLGGEQTVDREVVPFQHIADHAGGNCPFGLAKFHVIPVRRIAPLPQSNAVVQANLARPALSGCGRTPISHL